MMQINKHKRDGRICSVKESKNKFVQNICIALNAFFRIKNLTIANALSKM
jgi:hypothetical protein